MLVHVMALCMEESLWFSSTAELARLQVVLHPSSREEAPDRPGLACRPCTM